MTIKLTLLIGLGNSGKSTTIREFASLSGHKLKRGVNKFLINNKLIFVYNSSPQEKSAYCNFNDVNRRIDKFLNYIAKIAIRKSISDFTVVMAFTIKTRKTQIGKDCIINPLNMLKSGGHIVKVVYLRRKRHDAQRIDDFINSKVKPDLVIDSNEQYTRQAQELKDFISRQ